MHKSGDRKLFRCAKRRNLKELKQNPEFKGTKHLRFRAEAMATCLVNCACGDWEEHSATVVEALENEMASGKKEFLKKAVCKIKLLDELSRYHRQVWSRYKQAEQALDDSKSKG